MSSYRNYVPWKSSVSLPSSSSSYKPGYTSRDETTTTPKFGSISSTTAYRPSYSGGTYKSVPVKKESSGQYTTGSRYSSSVQDDKEKEKEKNKSLTSDSSLGKSQSSTSGQKKYDGTLSNKENASSLKSSGSTRGSTSNLSVSATSVADRLSKLGRRSRDPSPAGKYELHRPSTTSLSATSRIRSRDPSPVMVNALRGRLSRETSPVSDRRTTNIMTRVRSREPSPAYSSLRGRSRDPSPSSTSISGLSTPSSYRLNSRLTTTSGYGPKYSSNTSLTRAEKTALSYMSSSDMRARSSVRQSERREKKTIPTSITSSSSTTHSSEILGSKSSRSHSIDTNRTSRKDNFPEKDTVRNTPTVEPETLVSLSVTTRATSPTPPGSSVMSSSRLRRTEIAKTIEKTIQRPLRKRHTCVDKQIQSDRLDDSTKYSRFSGASTRISSIPWSPSTSLENKYLRYSSGSVALTSGGSSTSLASAASSSNLNKTSSQEISSKKDEESSELRSATKLPSKQTVNKQKSLQKHKSSESSSSRSLPPAIPKAESPTKVVTTTSSNAISSGTNGSKWLNKDFRKSALNIGPTDRPRKSRTPSVGTDSEERNDHVSNKGSGSQIQQRIERSPSVSSETSSDSRNNSSVTSSRSSDSENSRKVIHKHRCVQPQPQQQQRQMGQQKRQPLKSKLKSSQSSSTEKSEETNSTAKSKSNADNSGVYNKNESVGNSGDNNTQFVGQDNVAISNNKISTTGDSSQYNENSTEKSTKSATPPSSSISTASSLIRKLGFVSNFFAQRSQDPNSEAIYLDKSSSNTSNPIKENPQQHPPEGAPFDSSVSKNDSTIAVASSGAANSSNDTKTTATAATNSNSKLSSKNSKSIESDPDSSSWWLNTSQQIDTESALDIKDNEMRYKIRHIDSGETAWWLKNDEDDTVAEDLKTYVQDDSISDKSSYDMMKVFNGEDRTEGRTEQNSEWDQNKENNSSKNSSSLNQVKNSKTSSSNDWWFGENYVEKEKEKSSGKDENDKKNVAEIERSLSKSNSNKSKSSWKSSCSKNVNNLNEKSTQDNEKSENSQKIDKQDHSPWWMLGPTKKLFHLRPIESGERAWWLQDDEKSSKSTDPLPNGKKLPTNDEETDDENDIDDEEEELVNITKNVAMQNYLDQPPLGDRASPEGLEDTSQERKSPYDNVPRRKSGASLHQQNKAPIRDMDTKAGGNHFISRHRNIDELLGGSMRPLSPLMDRFLDKSAFLEEVTPSQVRIHDSTARMPHIQRMGKDECDCSGSALERNVYPQVELDDAALQVYKDGDYGAYLDLESSLAEQAEEIEGLNSSRKNSLVVRTQLSVRVHSIIEKLLSSEGSELRRALFSLKQIFQEDKDLVHGFVALGGLNCLVRVGNGADQNYQNYILRALGQVLLYVDGMNGVMKHGPTIQWLYSLIASKYRLVVKTALKLLLVFVEYVESNCYLLVNAIHNVDNAQGTLPWSNIMRLLKDYENADTELLIYATSLINKTLSGLSDQDSFYDESDLLEQQGMEAVIQRYMSRPGTDLDLLDQLQLYEAVLKFEDGETDAIRLPDNSIRKTLRCRTSTDSKERRKSRRHSTGTSPSINQNPIAMKKPTPPPPPPPPLPGHLYQQQHPSIEEDSSSSSNNSISGGVFRECRGHREGAGVTPGLRRRRERAERQKNFMKEQEAAAANGLRQSFGSKDELNGLGQIVTAIPVHLQNGNDSPPDSLQNSNNSNNNNGNINLGNDKTPPLSSSSSSSSVSSSSLSSSSSLPDKNHYNGQPKVLSSTSISVITNGFDRIGRISNSNKNNLNGNLINYKTTNTANEYNSIMNNKQNLIINNNNRNQSKANGYENEKDISAGMNGFSNHNETNGENGNINLKDYYAKYENETNRLSNYYYQQNKNNMSGDIHNNNTTTNISNNNNSQVHSNLILNNKNFNKNVEDNLNKMETLLNGNSFGNKESLQQSRVHGNFSHSNYGNRGGSAQTKESNGQLHLQSANIPVSTQSTDTNGNLNGKAVTAEQESENEDKKLLLQLKRDHTVKDLTQKLSSLPTSPQEDKPQNRIGDMTGLISKAKEGLAKSKSKGEISRSPSVDQDLKKAEQKKSENELHWEELVRNISRPLILCDLDFNDLKSDDDLDITAPRGLGGTVPPPPPPMGIMGGPPPPTNLLPPPTNLVPLPGFNAPNRNKLNDSESNTNSIKKNKKTVKLFWKEVREDLIPASCGKTIWDELPKADVDIQKLEHLFESRAKDLLTKKQQEMNKNKEIIVLDHKRSNAINIAMTKLPPPRAIKAAILKMDATVVTREGIDKLLNMLPTEEERGKIQEAQMSNPELPLGSAEQFLLTLSSISELAARLKLWAFKLDFENIEREITEPLMDLKQGLELLKANKTFKCILSTLLSVGIFLNGAPVKGFQIEYLSKVPEVKDTVHKHSLLHHLCHMVMESSPDTTDLYSEIGPITRASKADFTELAHNLVQLETECKASWDRLKLIAKHDCPPQMKQKLVDFLADCAERIILLQIVHKRVVNRYKKFLLWLGVPQHRVAESKPNEFCRILSEFALEYRTTRERVHQQIEKKANHRERNKTRGKMIIDVAKFRSQEDRADAELKQLLGSPTPDMENTDGTLTWRRRRAENLRSTIMKQSEENFTDGDDEILESLVKTATKAPGHRSTPRERKRTRHADRKSLKRSRTREGFTVERIAASPEH